MRAPGSDVDIVPLWVRPLWALGLALPLLLLGVALSFRAPSEPSRVRANRLGSPGLRAAIESELPRR